MKDRKKSTEAIAAQPLVKGRKLGDVAALRRTLAGERSLKALYDSLSASLRGDARFLVSLAASDYDRRFSELLAGGAGLLKELKAPATNEIAAAERSAHEQASLLKGRRPRELIREIAAFAQRTLITGSLVPWVSESQEVYTHFKDACEAEDGHLGLLELLQGLLE